MRLQLLEQNKLRRTIHKTESQSTKCEFLTVYLKKVHRLKKITIKIYTITTMSFR